MKALVCSENGFASELPADTSGTLAPHVELREVDRPLAGPGQAVVEVELASVNPSDEMFVRGLYGLPRKAGVPAGFEGVGRVVEVGSGLMGRAVKGKRVAFYANHSGTWASHALTDIDLCIPVKETLRAEDAAGFLVNPFTAYALNEMIGEAKAASFVLSAAASQMSKFLVRLASEDGRRPIATVRREEQIEPLKALGAAHVLNESEDGFAERMRSVLAQEKPILFLDAVAGDRQARIFDMMGDRARWVVYGRLDPKPPTLRKPEDLIFQRKRIEGFWLADWFDEASFVRKALASRSIEKRFERGEWRTDVTSVVLLDEAIDRMADERAKPDGKVFIRP